MVRSSSNNATAAARDTRNSRPGPESGADAGPDLMITQTTPGMATELDEKHRSQGSTSRSHSGSTAHTPKWWKIHLFRGMINDVRRRAPYYWSDWKDALDYRVVPATVYMYFAKYENTHTHLRISSTSPLTCEDNHHLGASH